MRLIFRLAIALLCTSSAIAASQAEPAPALVKPVGRASNDPREMPREAVELTIVTENPVPGSDLPPAVPVQPTRAKPPRAKNDPREKAVNQ